MYKILLLAAAAVLSFGSAANAATITMTLDNAGAIVGASYSGALTGNISPASAVLTGFAAVEPAGYSVPGLTASPTGLPAGSQYVYVPGTAAAPSSATFGLSLTNASTNSFGLTWGTIDLYNTLTLNSSNGVAAITGTALLNALNSFLGIPYALTGSNAVIPSTTIGLQEDIIFYNPFGSIITAVLTSSANSFEAANFTGANIPLPGAALLFGSGLVALFGVAKKKARR